MSTLKLAIACKSRDNASAYAAEIGAVLFRVTVLARIIYPLPQ